MTYRRAPQALGDRSAPLPAAAPAPLQVRWSALDVLADWPAGMIQPPPQALIGELWVSMQAEHDATHLLQFVRGRGLLCSDAMATFLRAWAEDEWNHYTGLRRIYATVTSVAERTIHAQLTTIEPDFSRLLPLLPDEFALCITLTYDELANARNYGKDAARYRLLGDAAVDFVRRAARDELLHCRNAVACIAHQHHHRLPEAGALIARLVEHDCAPDLRYRATFLFDHAPHPGYNEFGPAFFQKCDQMLIARLDKIAKGPRTCCW